MRGAWGFAPKAAARVWGVTLLCTGVGGSFDTHFLGQHLVAKKNVFSHCLITPSFLMDLRITVTPRS